ncbi:UV radiation resistance protein and autophagy-related subunit 14-domain containing protein [Nitzschia inconspicua]|uniref:UV radiation resistance protein and autophagy-related subunit 14-domain containing protein n=1 Tax=Nitzschia inconspicua TaxID=303405 RepID=A0A9K3L1Y9_9STRA|nr:UV radiation resistance protein and autophagy-related subunit 14-domain containing protein [Nitzschia inconspicua]
MFPTSRDSLRRWRSDSADQTHNYAVKTPIPVAVVLHNFIRLQQQQEQPKQEQIESSTTESPVSSANKTDQDVKSPKASQSNWRFHDEHTMSLLPLLHLDITVTPENKEDQSISVYSQTLRRRSVHPSWEHLDERIRLPAEKECSSSSTFIPLWNNHELYKSMRIKLFLVDDKESTVSTKEKNTDKDSNAHKLLEFLEAPLHPSLLQRIDMKPAAAISDDGSNDNDDEDELLLANSVLPPLPPNALLVHFSDGSIRCLPHIHQLVCEQHPSKTLAAHQSTIEDFSRFEDDVFKTLDHVHTTPQRRERTASSLLDQEELDQKEDPSTSPSSYPRIPEDEVFSLEREMEQKLLLRETVQKGSYPCSEEQAREEDREAERELLKRQIAEEERLFEEEILSFRKEQTYLAALVQELKDTDDEIALIQSEIQSQSLGLRQDNILKQAQSIKLVRDLEVVYPITLDTAATTSSTMSLSIIGSANTRSTAGGYLIRGLRLPVDIYTTTVPEEEINASLGYCSHLVYMIAKYLTIQLRHRIFCNSSRSAIQQDGVGVFPLFLGRMVARSLEREQVDRGARLLGANVNCILMHLNMPESLQQVHILARLQAILRFVATGNIPNNKIPRTKSSDSVASAS